MSIFDDAALLFSSQIGTVVEGYTRRSTRPDGTIHELHIDRLRINESPVGLEVLNLLLNEKDGIQYLSTGKPQQEIVANPDADRSPLLTDYLELFL